MASQMQATAIWLPLYRRQASVRTLQRREAGPGAGEGGGLERGRAGDGQPPGSRPAHSLPALRPHHRNPQHIKPAAQPSTRRPPTTAANHSAPVVDERIRQLCHLRAVPLLQLLHSGAQRLGEQHAEQGLDAGQDDVLTQAESLVESNRERSRAQRVGGTARGAPAAHLSSERERALDQWSRRRHERRSWHRRVAPQHKAPTAEGQRPSGPPPCLPTPRTL